MQIKWDEERNLKWNTKWKAKWDETEGKKWSSVYGRMGMIFLSASAVAILVMLADNGRNLPENKEGASVIERNEPGKGEKAEIYELQIGENKTEVEVRVQERKYTQEELEKIFLSSREKLEKLVLGENTSPDDVRKNLNLVEELPGTGITVSWELDSYKTVNILGKLQKENLTDAGTLVELKATLQYGEASFEHRFSVRVYPPRMTEEEKYMQELTTSLEKMDKEQQEKKEMTLPKEMNGKSVTWKYPKEFRGVIIFAAGILMMILLYISERQKQKEIVEKRRQKLLEEYPQLISTFTLLLGAGMTVRGAWNRIVEDYKKKENASSVICEEMQKSIYEMQNGYSESECYERFGDRCGNAEYRKFSALLSQNMKKGAKGIVPLLKQEAETAFEEQKNRAKQKGEEAGTKLLGPMMLMLVIVLIIIVIPAFLSIQI